MISFSAHHFLNFDNAWRIFILFDFTENWIINIEVGYIIHKVIVMFKFDTMLPKKCIKCLSS